MKHAWLMLALLLAACAPKEQAFNPATQPPALTSTDYITADDVKLPLRIWLPKGKTKAVILALHGFNDYSNAFTPSGEYFQKRGIATYAYDQRGFGSAPQTGIWPGEENLVRDVDDAIAALAKKHRNTPIFLMGESMGGAVALVAASHTQLPVRGIILSSPAVWGDHYMPALYSSLLWVSAHTLPGYKVTGEGLKILACNNIPLLRAMGRDKLVQKATRIDAIYGLTHLMNDAYHAPKQVKNQSLMLYGFKDQVIPKAPVEDIQNHFGGPLRAIYYDDGYHMLTRDLQGEAVMEDIARWVLEKR